MHKIGHEWHWQEEYMAQFLVLYRGGDEKGAWNKLSKEI